jgi:hypothetical protein
MRVTLGKAPLLLQLDALNILFHSKTLERGRYGERSRNVFGSRNGLDHSGMGKWAKENGGKKKERREKKVVSEKMHLFYELSYGNIVIRLKTYIHRPLFGSALYFLSFSFLICVNRGCTLC